MSSADEKLEAAREAGEPGAIADALVEHAGGLVQQGLVPDARAELDEAAALFGQLERAMEQARALHSAASLCRFAGDLDAAEDRARRAEALADDNTPTIVAAIMEQGEAAFLRGHYGDAADHYGRALVHARAAGLLPNEEGRVLRKRAASLAAAERFDEALADVASGRELHRDNEAPGEARRAGVEHAVILEQAGRRPEEVSALLAALIDEAEAAEDHHVVADAELLAAGRSAAAGDLEDALARARRARKAALECTAVLSYVSAAVTIADVCDALGDRAGAYESLAVGWVTTGDALGDKAAKELFQPRVEALRRRWGASAFDEVKTAYEDRRRDEILRGG